MKDYSRMEEAQQIKTKRCLAVIRDALAECAKDVRPQLRLS